MDKPITKNEIISLMHTHSSNTLISIAGLAKKQKMKASELIDYMIEVGEEMAAQSMLVSIKDELKLK